jgi:hypothetical protein
LEQFNNLEIKQLLLLMLDSINYNSFHNYHVRGLLPNFDEHLKNRGYVYSDFPSSSIVNYFELTRSKDPKIVGIFGGRTFVRSEARYYEGFYNPLDFLRLMKKIKSKSIYERYRPSLSAMDFFTEANYKDIGIPEITYESEKSVIAAFESLNRLTTQHPNAKLFSLFSGNDHLMHESLRGSLKEEKWYRLVDELFGEYVLKHNPKQIILTTLHGIHNSGGEPIYIDRYFSDHTSRDVLEPWKGFLEGKYDLVVLQEGDSVATIWVAHPKYGWKERLDFVEIEKTDVWEATINLLEKRDVDRIWVRIRDKEFKVIGRRLEEDAEPQYIQRISQNLFQSFDSPDIILESYRRYFKLSIPRLFSWRKEKIWFGNHGTVRLEDTKCILWTKNVQFPHRPYMLIDIFA